MRNLMPEELKEKLIAHAKKGEMVSIIAEKLGLNKQAAYQCVKRRLGSAGHPSTAHWKKRINSKKDIVMNGFFNVHERENWLA